MPPPLPASACGCAELAAASTRDLERRLRATNRRVFSAEKSLHAAEETFGRTVAAIHSQGADGLSGLQLRIDEASATASAAAVASLEGVSGMQERMDEMRGVLAAATERVEALEVELQMKQALGAASHQTAERRSEQSRTQIVQHLQLNTKQVAKLAAAVAQLAAGLEAAKAQMRANETAARMALWPRLDASLPTRWTVDQVGLWLERLGLAEQYSAMFREHEIDGATLCELDASAWTTLGVYKLGHQSILKRAIAEAGLRSSAPDRFEDTRPGMAVRATARDAGDDSGLQPLLMSLDGVSGMQERMDEMCGALAAATDRMDALEVELQMKQALGAVSQAATERSAELLGCRMSRADDALAALEREIKDNRRRQAKLIGLTLRVQECAEEAASDATVRHAHLQAVAAVTEAEVDRALPTSGQTEAPVETWKLPNSADVTSRQTATREAELALEWRLSTLVDHVATLY